MFYASYNHILPDKANNMRKEEHPDNVKFEPSERDKIYIALESQTGTEIGI
jgi:urease accessory protein UreE